MPSDVRLELVKSETGRSAELFVYGYIGTTWDGSGVDPKRIARQISEFDGDLIKVSINSGGGRAMDGVAIYNALRKSSARIEVNIDGIAASAASVIAMAGDVVRMPRGSFLMIHNPHTVAWGFAKDLRSQADVLDKMSAEFIGIYKARSGMSDDDVKKALDAETWYAPDEAKLAGLADEIEDAVVDAYAHEQSAVFAGVSIPREMIPENIYKTLRPAASIPSTPPEKPKKEAVKMDLETLKKEHPELYAQITASAGEAAAKAAREEGAKAERERIASIDAATVPGYEDLAMAAKKDPSKDGRDLAWDITQSIKEKGRKYLEDRKDDAAQVKAHDLPNPEAGNAETEASRKNKMVDDMVALINEEEV